MSSQTSSSNNALLAFSIGPVHAFVAQARKMSDLWTGSSLLSFLMSRAIASLRSSGGELVLPFIGSEPEEGSVGGAEGQELLAGAFLGLPNRLLCRIAAEDAEELACRMEKAVLDAWQAMVRGCVEKDLTELRRLIGVDLLPDSEVETAAQDVFQVHWAWVPEKAGYEQGFREVSRFFDAAKRFRPFSQQPQPGVKCAQCGERTALPDGDFRRVRSAWEQVSERTAVDLRLGPELREYQGLLRFEQGKICLVCTVKRLAWMRKKELRALTDRFKGFDIYAELTARDEDQPYFALVEMDGDKFGDAFSWGCDDGVRDIEGFHRALSRFVWEFARDLRSSDKARPNDLNLSGIGIPTSEHPPDQHWPQLIYAGGEDVRLCCRARDALAIVQAIRKRFVEGIAEVEKNWLPEELHGRLTISAAILFAHWSHPAGRLYREVHQLLDEVAKELAGRNSLAIKLIKRSGEPVSVVMGWDDPGLPLPQPSSESVPAHPQGEETDRADHTLVGLLGTLIQNFENAELASGAAFGLRDDIAMLRSLFADDAELWQPWLTDRLSRSAVSGDQAEGLARRLVPFFLGKLPDTVDGKPPNSALDKTNALRIARFLGSEIGKERGVPTSSVKEQQTTTEVPS